MGSTTTVCITCHTKSFLHSTKQTSITSKANMNVVSVPCRRGDYDVSVIACNLLYWTDYGSINNCMHFIPAKYNRCTKKHMKLSMCILTLASSTGFHSPTVSRNFSLYRPSLGQDTLELWQLQLCYLMYLVNDCSGFVCSTYSTVQWSGDNRYKG